MAKFKDGPWGGFSGAVGPVESYMLNGQLIMRSRRAKPSRPPTEKQLACRAKMRLINEVLGCMSTFINIGFAGIKESTTINAYNAAVAYNLKHAITGSYPDFEIDYEKLLVAKGDILTDGINASVSLQDKTLKFQWHPDTVYPRSTDHAMLLAYAPALNQAVYNLCGAKRRKGQDVLLIPENWLGVGVNTFLSFHAEATNEYSNSIYLGES